MDRRRGTHRPSSDQFATPAPALGVGIKPRGNAVTTIEDPDLMSGAALDEELAALAKEYAEARDLVSEATARKDEALCSG
jgi:hypothetical protein